MQEIEGADYGLHIDGAARPAADGGTITTVDPATGQPQATVARATTTDVDAAVTAAKAAQREWRDVQPEVRGRRIRTVAEHIRDHLAELASLETRDQGKPRRQAESDFEGAARYFEYYGGAADKLEGESVPMGPDQVDFTVREPYGVSAQITPWNFPGNLFARGVAPALVAGNAVVLKPAPQTPLTSLRLAALCEAAGLPEGLVNVVPGPGDPTGVALTGHEDVDTITFTGSVTTGKAIMESAAEHVTPVTLELGGKNPALVFEDADIEAAADWIETGIFTNAGQVCSAADRVLVEETVYDAFVEAICDRVADYELGPGSENPDMGPLASEAQFDRVTRHLELAQTEGATVACGGGTPDREGYFIEPTVLTDVEPDARVAQEEIFGPVLSVISVASESEALRVANDVEYGLVAGVFTTDLSRAHRLARRLEAGNVYVNKWFGDTVQTPFGGYKESGIGREKGLEALDSYLQTKNVAIGLGDDIDLPAN
ncbi:MAG: aldehyde dehydrogenase [Halobacteriaceae archaeon]